MLVRIRHLALAAAAVVVLGAAWPTPVPRADEASVAPTTAAPGFQQLVTGGPAPACIADWSEAGPIVRQEGLAGMEKVGRLARDRAAADVIKSTLCKADDRYVYRLTLRSARGELRTLYVDARQPFER